MALALAAELIFLLSALPPEPPAASGRSFGTALLPSQPPSLESEQRDIVVVVVSVSFVFISSAAVSSDNSFIAPVCCCAKCRKATCVVDTGSNRAAKGPQSFS